MGRKIIKYTLITLGALLLIIAFLLWRSNDLLQDRIEQANNKWKSYEPQQIDSMGATSLFRITPLIDWHTSDDSLETEMGVSYFIETDSVNILFDLGYNAENDSVSPLSRNMAKMDIDLDDIDIIFISHNHFDHVGGTPFMKQATFGINPGQHADLSDKKIYTPIDMSYPGASTKTTRDPTVLASGVATTGTIPRALFIGDIDEQSLIINVRGRGLVIIVGCSHPTVSRIVQRTQEVFDKNIYGIIGGLHYPVPEGRMKLAGINVQRYLASGDGPFAPLQMKEIKHEMNLIADQDPSIVGVGGHDSSDEVIEMFEREFGPSYYHVQVGLSITVEGDTLSVNDMQI
ncbi:MAG: MBL fold metallo-hydrolase [Saprospiraceae bacterium]|nr:MBL fold metallo-hydrolase [Saprospiraceae bacterium]